MEMVLISNKCMVHNYIFGQTRNSRVKEIWNQVCIQNQEESARIVLLWHKEQGKVEEKNHLM